MNLSRQKGRVASYMDEIAGDRIKWLKRNRYYHNDLIRFFKYNILQKSSVLDIGCGVGQLLGNLNPEKGIGIDTSKEAVDKASKSYRQYRFIQMDAENIRLQEKFDYIIISDAIGYFEDVQKAFNELGKVCTPKTRILITYQNFLWLPILNLAETLHLKMPSRKLNWLGVQDIENLLNLEGFETIKKGSRLLLPKYLPLISWFLNKYIARLPLMHHLCLTNYIIAKPVFSQPDNKKYSVSVIIPARNEAGNIENAVKRIPQMGRATEIIFVEGNSTDNTLEEIKMVCEKYARSTNISYCQQDHKGKGDAVRKGFAKATGDILMILDADLTVSPEDLTKFYNAIANGRGEYINGTRLVYPMEKEAMRFLNMLGNRFFSLVFTWLLDQRIKDTLCGTKVLFRADYERLAANRHFFGDFDPFGDFDLLFGSAKLNLKLVEVPIRYQAREYGSTNISRFRHGWLLLKMVFFAMNKIKFS